VRVLGKRERKTYNNEKRNLLQNWIDLEFSVIRSSPRLLVLIQVEVDMYIVVDGKKTQIERERER